MNDRAIGIRKQYGLPEVVEMPVVAGLGVKGSPRHKLDGYKALMVIGEDTDPPVLFNIVTEAYTVTRHEEVIAMALSVADEMPEYGTPDLSVALLSDGAKMRAELVWPDVLVDVHGDKLNPRMTFSNSYDGSWALRGIFGAFRLICSNGLTIGEKWAVYRQEHHQLRDLDRLRAALRNGMNRLSEQTAMWEAWADRVLEPREYASVIDALSLNKTELEELGTEVEVSSGERITVDPRDHGGPSEITVARSLSLWLFYNLVMQMITHRIEGVRRARLEEQARQVFGGLR